MSTEFKDIYVTKYWAARGIIHVKEAKVVTYENGSRAAYWGNYFNAAHGPEIHDTYEEACAHVVELTKKKLKSLSKSADKIKSIQNQAKAKNLKLTEDDNQADRMRRERGRS